MAARVDARGLLLRGEIWSGDGPSFPGWLAVGADGTIAAMTPGDPPAQSDVPVIGGAHSWVGPGVVDTHVHLAFGSPEAMLAGGVVAVRDLGAPPGDAARWQNDAQLTVAVAGPLVTAPDGYPSRTWGAAGFTRQVGDSQQARTVVTSLAASEVDLIKLALEPAQGQPVPDGDTARAVVEAAHEFGLSVTCHALTAPMVERALAAGVDELCHTPTEPLSSDLVERLAAARIPVVSTLHTLLEGGDGDGPMRNARAFLRAGIPLLYGTDLGNTATRPGAEPLELERLVEAGLARSQALRAATVGAAAAEGLYGRIPNGLRTGGPATCVVLDADPLEDFDAFRHPRAVIVDGRALVGGPEWIRPGPG